MLLSGVRPGVAQQGWATRPSEVSVLRVSCLLSSRFTWGQMVTLKTIQNDDFWNNPWDVGGLIVIGLFTSTFLFFIVFAIVFGFVEKTLCRED